MSRGSVETRFSPEYAILLELVREARVESNMTQKAICDKLGKPRNYLLKVEAGERRLDVVELFRLCGAMGTDPMRLLSDFSQRLGRLEEGVRGASAPDA